jgi:phospholipid/cholesterol/gamma-HCH transport system ATP-binding protein
MNIRISYPPVSETDYPVDIEGLTVRYGERIILHEVDYRAHRGGINVVIGGSGCGKSTLLRHALGLQAPLAGNIKLLGQRIEECTDEEVKKIRRRIGVLFQNGALFSSMSVGENVAVVIRENTDLPEEIISEMVEMKLAQVGLHDVLDKFPEQLSGGMRKRAALARAIATDPEMLFCDEPSAGLDPVVASELDDLLLSLNAHFGMTMLVVTHDIESIKKIADRVAMLDGGNIVAEGTLGEVMQSLDPRVQDFFNRISHAEEKAQSSIFSAAKRGGAR